MEEKCYLLGVQINVIKAFYFCLKSIQKVCVDYTGAAVLPFLQEIKQRPARRSSALETGSPVGMMGRLSEIRSNQRCVITWLVGRCASWIKETFSFAENDELFVISNLGKGGVIVSRNGHSFALSADAAASVRVRPV